MSQLANFSTLVEELPSATSIWEAALAEYVENSDGEGTVRELEDGREVLFWEDGAGNEATFIRPALPGGPEDSIIVRIYDHESDFNLYGFEGNINQPALDGLPEELKSTVEDPEIFWFSWEEEANRTYATAFLWNVDGVWEYTEAFRQALEESDDDGGVRYVLAPIADVD